MSHMDPATSKANMDRSPARSGGNHRLQLLTNHTRLSVIESRPRFALVENIPCPRNSLAGRGHAMIPDGKYRCCHKASPYSPPLFIQLVDLLSSWIDQRLPISGIVVTLLLGYTA